MSQHSPIMHACSQFGRPRVNGKFIFVGNEKLYIHGVTYGPFRPDDNGCEYGQPERVERDFAQMAALGINTVRTYTVPPRWLLDIAQRHHLRLMIGLPWEQHMTFLDDKELVQSIENRVREGVRSYAGHPAVLCYAIGNEIPSSIIRWHGRRAVERFLKRLYDAAKSEDPESLVTYVNYPTSEYLRLPFLDFACFNVYLEKQERLEAYLAQLHNVVGDVPLVLAEIGLDSLSNGEDTQAEVLNWQVRTAFAQGCAGAFVFAWTDEWYRGGEDIVDWNFGLTDRERRPKPALTTVSEVFAETPFPADTPWPRISVVVCSYNGSRTIADCCEGLSNLDYPDYEVIVVDDGSTDGTGDIASGFGFQVIRTRNQGLSTARNTGLEAATGEIIAYIDDDAYPDPHWLTYLAESFRNRPFAGIGGPNLTPDHNSLLSKCIGEAPGGPTHVLLTDSKAEHIPGVNMAFRKACLEEIGGFDPQFWIAGDDVDVCWQIQEKGWELGYNPAAVVWHHRRPSVRAYWKQQSNYGKAEALLEQKWPEKYNAFGHVLWSGRVYGSGAIEQLPWRRGRIYQGTWGTALFQSIYQPAHAGLSAITLMPEWYICVLVLGLFSALGAVWEPLLYATPLFFLAAGMIPLQVGTYIARSNFVTEGVTHSEKGQRGLILMLLCFLQPLARLTGRLRAGLTLFRRNGWKKRWSAVPPIVPKSRTTFIWSERWRSSIDWLHMVEAKLREEHLAIRRGGNYDNWDLEVRTGQLSSNRLLMTVEEHGDKRQMIRLRIQPTFSRPMGILLFLLLFPVLGASMDGVWVAAVSLAFFILFMGVRIMVECAQTMAIVLEICQQIARQQIEEIRKRRAQANETSKANSRSSANGHVNNEVKSKSIQAPQPDTHDTSAISTISDELVELEVKALKLVALRQLPVTNPSDS